ncbi:MAG: hypothetical protein U0235_10540 [Polyangiaceae bacterium]
MRKAEELGGLGLVAVGLLERGHDALPLSKSRTESRTPSSGSGAPAAKGALVAAPLAAPDAS